ncbi:hypothetical protein JMN32_13565 [Fulvivirga sp. 29W222]|uniref:Uncharacterized protein n=1 Tax=Fulvivirga marina TaxID=2494733 RepID=A0A937G2P4_9BACT|nr:hypothetical protein [Fulvivirga marina]MBL6447341.1 hypothetical protein [Fulvivirga marina]
MTKFVKDKSANILNFLAMNRVVAQFSRVKKGNDRSGVLNISNDVFADFFEELNEREIHYLAVGDIAGAYHGYPRTSGGLELWLSHDDENIQKIQHLLELGAPINADSEGRVVKFRGETFKLTIYLQMLHYTQQDFCRCHSESELAVVLNTTIPVLGKKDYTREMGIPSKTGNRKMIKNQESQN